MESWYGVGLLFRSDHTRLECEALFEESVFLVRAGSEGEAEQLAAAHAERGEVMYEASPDEYVKWTFVRVTHAFEMTDPEPAAGAEVFSRFLDWHAVASLGHLDRASDRRAEGADAMATIEDGLPNGLHDADLHAVAFESRQRVLRFEMAADCSNPDAGERERRLRRGVLTIEDATIFQMPAVLLALDARAKGMWIESARRDWGNSNLQPVGHPRGQFLHEFFLQEHNDSVLFAGRSATWMWLEGARRT